MLVQAMDLVKFWKSSKVDGFVWMATCLASLLAGVSLGLVVGLALTTFILVQTNINFVMRFAQSLALVMNTLYALSIDMLMCI